MFVCMCACVSSCGPLCACVCACACACVWAWVPADSDTLVSDDLTVQVKFHNNLETDVLIHSSARQTSPIPMVCFPSRIDVLYY